MQLLEGAIRREARQQVAVGAALFLLGAYLAYNTFHSNVPLMVIGLAIALISAKLLHYAIVNLKEGNNRLLQILEKQPRQIVWVYSMVVERVPFGIHLYRSGTIFFKLSDGMELSVRLPVRYMRTVSRFLNRLLPHATFGYSADREYSFRLSPESLRKSNDE